VSKTCITVGILAIAAATSGCITHGPDGVAYSTGSSQSVGATGSGAGGVLEGSGTPAPEVEKEKRGNTPVGTDRDGHGPAAGAIIDPTGAATRTKPY
jgi:hypothetical protein